MKKTSRKIEKKKFIPYSWCGVFTNSMNERASNLIWHLYDFPPRMHFFYIHKIMTTNMEWKVLEVPRHGQFHSSCWSVTSIHVCIAFTRYLNCRRKKKRQKYPSTTLSLWKLVDSIGRWCGVIHIQLIIIKYHCALFSVFSEHNFRFCS